MALIFVSLAAESPNQGRKKNFEKRGSKLSKCNEKNGASKAIAIVDAS